MSSASSSVTSAPVRLTGRVKWFNNKTGFGFISVVGGNDQYKDASEIFVHHSAVTVSQEQYRYLVEGEYVEFSVVVTESGDHKFQAGDVRGVKGGKLFCETRNEHRATREGAGASGERSERGRAPVRGRGRGGHVDRGDRGERGGSEWMLVRRDRVENSDSRGHYGGGRGGGGARGRGRVRVEDYSERHSSRTQSSAPTDAAPAPSKQEVNSVGDVSATPRASAKKAPRQSKPSA